MSSWPTDRPRLRHGARLLLLVAVTAALAALLTAPASAADVSARTLLAQITVRAEAGGSTYDRSAFRHWVDADGDGCTTRAEVLVAESSVSTSRTGTCTITTGRWTSYYDGVVTTVASELDIDHMVPLKEAWISGASGWTAARREAFANDLGHAPSLVAVSASSNRSKADRDPSAWLPPLAGARCRYAKEWVAVKWRWNLSANSAEISAVDAALGSCSSLSVAQPSRA